MDKIFQWLQPYYYFVFMGGGLLIMVGAIRNWNWVVRWTNQSKLAGTRAFIEGLHGEEGRLKFERFFIFFGGLMLVIAGVFFMLYEMGIIHSLLGS